MQAVIIKIHKKDGYYGWNPDLTGKTIEYNPEDVHDSIVGIRDTENQWVGLTCTVVETGLKCYFCAVKIK